MALGGVVAGSARVIVGADTHDLDKGLHDAERSFTGTVGRMRGHAVGIAGVIGGVIGGTLAVALKSSVDAASNLEEQLNKTSTVFRGSEQDIIAWSETTATSFGISQRAALEAAGTFGNMLVPMGFARDAAGEMSEKMVELAADMASFNNASPQETLDAIRSGLAGETEPLRRFGVFLNESRIQTEALNSGLITQGQTLTAAGKAQATYQIILKDTADTQGDFGRTSDSLANQQRILRAQFEEVQAEIGQKLLPVLVRFLRWVNGSFLPEMRQFGDDTAAVWRFIKEQALLALRDIVDPFSHLPGELGKWARDIKENVNDELAKMSAEEGIRSITEQFDNWDVTAATDAGARVGKAWVSSLLGEVTPYLDALTGETYVPPGQQPGVTQPGKPVQGAGAGVRVPQTFRSTHETSGLAGYPAVDIFADPGTAVLAPEDGAIVRHSGHGGTSGQVYGWSIYYDGFETGSMYFMTHLATRSPLGTYREGDVLGTISAWSGGAPHVHVGQKRGAKVPKGKLPDYGTDKPKPKPTKTTELVPQRLRLDVSRARAAGDEKAEIAALEAVEQYLLQRIAGEKRIEEKIRLLDELASTRSRIESLTPDPKKKDKPKKAIDELVPDRMRLALTRAEAEGDEAAELRALRTIENYLEKRLAGEKKINRQIEILSELRSVRSRIESLTEKDKPDKPPLIPKSLELRGARAELTKTVTDDLAYLDDLIAYLVRRLDKERDVDTRIELLRELRSARDRRTAALAEEVADVGMSKAQQAFDKAIDALIGRGSTVGTGRTRYFGPPAPTDEAAERRKEEIAGQLTPEEAKKRAEAAAERKAQLGRVLAPLTARADEIRGYWNELNAKKKAAEARIKVLQGALKKLKAVKPRLRDRRAIARTQNDLDDTRQKLKDIIEAMNLAVEAYGEIEAEITSETQKTAGEDEAAALEAPPTTTTSEGGGGGGEGGGGGAGGEGTPAPTGQELAALAEQNRVGFLTGLRGLREFQPTVLAELGLGGSTITVQNFFPTPPPDSHAWAKALEFELRALAA